VNRSEPPRLGGFSAPATYGGPSSAAGDYTFAVLFGLVSVGVFAFFAGLAPLDAALNDSQRAAVRRRLADRDPAQPARRSALHTGSDHVYHSLTRTQSSVQKRIARNEAGKCPRRTPARTLMV